MTVHPLKHLTNTIGFGWLVRNGEVVPSPGNQIAPRTAIGVDKEGKLLMFEADGIEKKNIGLSLNQTAEWFKEMGAYHAINLDGGGSSTVFFNSSVVNHPTSTDTGYWAQRPVTTVTCIRYK